MQTEAVASVIISPGRMEAAGVRVMLAVLALEREGEREKVAVVVPLPDWAMDGEADAVTEEDCTNCDRVADTDGEVDTAADAFVVEAALFVIVLVRVAEPDNVREADAIIVPDAAALRVNEPDHVKDADGLEVLDTVALFDCRPLGLTLCEASNDELGEAVVLTDAPALTLPAILDVNVSVT
jgi:hypothetical protein